MYLFFLSPSTLNRDIYRFEPVEYLTTKGFYGLPRVTKKLDNFMTTGHGAEAGGLGFNNGKAGNQVIIKYLK